MTLAENATGKDTYAKSDALTDGSTTNAEVSWTNLQHNGTGTGWGLTTDSTTVTLKVGGPCSVEFVTYNGTTNNSKMNVAIGSTKLVTDFVSSGTSTVNPAFIYTGSEPADIVVSLKKNNYINKVIITNGTFSNSVAKVAISGATTIGKGGSADFTATITPKYVNTDSNKLGTQTITWSSSDTEVAIVNESGTVSAVSAGTTNIKASCGTVESEPVAVTISAKSVNTVKYLDLSKTISFNGSDSGEIMTMSALTVDSVYGTDITNPSKYEKSTYAQWTVGTTNNTISKETDIFWVSFDITPKEPVKLNKISLYSANNGTGSMQTVVTVGSKVVATQVADGSKISQITDAVIDSVISEKTTVKIAFQGTADIKKEISYRLASIVLSYENID